MKYWAVVGTRRGDLSEWVVALVSGYALARVVGWRTLDARPGLVRCRVRRVELTCEQVTEVVARWGREDVALGIPVAAADRLPEPYRAVYLGAYRAAVSDAAADCSSPGP